MVHSIPVESLLEKNEIKDVCMKSFAVSPYLFLALFFLLPGPAGGQTDEERIGLSPRTWPKADLERYIELNRTYNSPKPLVHAGKGMIGGTTGPLAIHAGLEVLKHGGSAADAAIATSLAQITLAGGSWNSFAGILYMVYYERDSKKAYSLNAGYNTVLAETDPLSIPKTPVPSGRTALVPGFMAGIEAAHKRFGKLSFRDLFEPAIYFAEEGIQVDAVLAKLIESRKDVLSRKPECRSVFTKKDGTLHGYGDLLLQPQLAETLRRVASQGASYMYTGEWGKRFVEAIRQEGGKISPEDMKNYKVQWEEALCCAYRDYEVCTIGFPELGSIQLLEAMNLFEHGNLKELGHYTQSPEALYWFIQVCRLGYVISYSSAYHACAGEDQPAIGISPLQRVKKETAQANWECLNKKGWELDLYNKLNSQGNHSDGVVAVDERGNVAALLHSINTVSWGTTGIFVDGVSIPDSASFQQKMIEKAGSGARLPNVVNPVIVLKEGEPVLAASCIGSGLHECMLQNLVNMLDFGMDPKASVDTPNFWGPAWSLDSNEASEYFKQTIPQGKFSKELLEGVRKLGQPFKELSPQEESGRIGYWIGIQIHQGKLLGALTQRLNGILEGF